MPIDEALFSRLPKLEIVSSFGVGYDHVDAIAAGKRGIVVTHTPDVLTEEVADTTLGLLLCTVRELPQAERYLRAGKWPEGNYPLSQATLRNRSVGLLGMGRIGVAIAAGSKHSACRSPTTRGTSGPSLPIGTTRGSSTWRAPWTRSLSSCPAAPRPETWSMPRCWKLSDPRVF